MAKTKLLNLVYLLARIGELRYDLTYLIDRLKSNMFSKIYRPLVVTYIRTRPFRYVATN